VIASVSSHLSAGRGRILRRSGLFAVAAIRATRARFTSAMGMRWFIPVRRTTRSSPSTARLLYRWRSQKLKAKP